MLVPSANDAAEALALHVGKGSIERFVDLMNAKARELGLTDTRFANPHGLDEAGHVSSARDATLLVRYALGVPFIHDALGRETFSLPGRTVFETTDDLLSSWPPLVAGKTGHTREAGWSQAAAAGGRGATVYGTVLGSDSRSARNDALRDLLRYGLSRYRRVQAIDPSRVYARAETGYGRGDVELVARESSVRTVRVDVPLTERIVAPASVELPIRKGQRLGRVDVYDGRRLVAASALVASEAVSEPGVVGKALWFATRTAENLWGIFS
jgi:D-alanyl-D-alanine carboxypeptidase